MTLYKQLSLAFSFIIVAILASVLYMNYTNAKTQLIETLYQNSVNNISTLAQKLASANDEEAVVTTIIDAEFSSGYYQKISYVSYGSKFTYTQEFAKKVEGVPAWFVSLAHIKLQTVSTEVTNGWDVLGKVSVLADSAIVYQTLYKIFLHLIVLFVVFFVIALGVLAVILHFILIPLKKIQKQAEAISDNEFIVNDELPFTKELREVSVAMNSMVQKVEKNFHQANQVAKRNHELLYVDNVTKLYNRRYLLLKLPEIIQAESKINGGVLIMLALSDAEALNKRLGYKQADEVFFGFAEILREHARSFDESIVARLNGTEFCMVLSGCDMESAKKIVYEIYDGFVSLLEHNGMTTQECELFIGASRYDNGMNHIELLQEGDYALMQAKANEEESIYFQEKHIQNTLTKEEWRTILNDAIEKDNFVLKFWDCVDSKAKRTLHKVMTFMIDDGKKKYFYGDFIPIAIELDLASEIYTHVLQKLFTGIQPTNDVQKFSVRLSNDFLKKPSSFAFLEKLFKEYGKGSQNRLIFEMSNSFCITYDTLANGYAELFRSYGFEVCINAFTNESGDMNYLKKFKASIIKADVSFLLDLSSDALNSLLLIANSLNIELVATAVSTMEELQKLHEYDITAIQGPLSDKI